MIAAQQRKGHNITSALLQKALKLDIAVDANASNEHQSKFNRKMKENNKNIERYVDIMLLTLDG